MKMLKLTRNDYQPVREYLDMFVNAEEITAFGSFLSGDREGHWISLKDTTYIIRESPKYIMEKLRELELIEGIR